MLRLNLQIRVLLRLHWFILCRWCSRGTALGGGCDQSIGSTVSDAIVHSWLWLTATRSSPLAASVHYCKSLIIDPTFCGCRFSTAMLLAIEDFTFTGEWVQMCCTDNLTPPVKLTLITHSQTNCNQCQRDSWVSSHNCLCIYVTKQNYNWTITIFLSNFWMHVTHCKIDAPMRKCLILPIITSAHGAVRVRTQKVEGEYD